jgi:hypothetical protein
MKEEARKAKRIKKSKSFLSAFKQEVNFFLPTAVIWGMRIFLGFQAYLYHNGNGLFHLSFVLLSFILSMKLTIFMSIVVMIPVYTFEFIMVYANRIPVLKASNLVMNFGKAYSMDLKYPIAEQGLYFIVLVLLVMNISCFKLTVQHDQNKYLVNRFEDLIKNGHMLSKLFFFTLRHI